MNQATTNLSAIPIQQQQLLQQQRQQYSTQIRASGYFDTTARGAVHFNRQPSTPSSNEFYNYDSPSPIPTNQMYGVMSNGFHSKPSAYRHSAPLSFVMNHSLHQNSNDPNYFAPNNSNARLSWKWIILVLYVIEFIPLVEFILFCFVYIIVVNLYRKVIFKLHTHFFFPSHSSDSWIEALIQIFYVLSWRFKTVNTIPRFKSAQDNLNFDFILTLWDKMSHFLYLKSQNSGVLLPPPPHWIFIEGKLNYILYLHAFNCKFGCC